MEILTYIIIYIITVALYTFCVGIGAKITNIELTFKQLITVALITGTLNLILATLHITSFISYFIYVISLSFILKIFTGEDIYPDLILLSVVSQLVITLSMFGILGVIQQLLG